MSKYIVDSKAVIRDKCVAYLRVHQYGTHAGHCGKEEMRRGYNQSIRIFADHHQLINSHSSFKMRVFYFQQSMLLQTTIDFNSIDIKYRQNKEEMLNMIRSRYIQNSLLSLYNKRMRKNCRSAGFLSLPAFLFLVYYYE